MSERGSMNCDAGRQQKKTPPASSLGATPGSSGGWRLLLGAGETALGAADSRVHVRERVVGGSSQVRDRSNANHDNKGQHDGVFNRGRAIFVLQEANKLSTK